MKQFLFLTCLLSVTCLYSQDRTSDYSPVTDDLKNVFNTSIHSYGLEGLTDTLGSTLVTTVLAAHAPFLIQGSYSLSDPLLPAGLALWGSASLVLAFHGPLTIFTMDSYGKRLKTSFPPGEEAAIFRLKLKSDLEALTFRRKAGGLLLASAGALLVLSPLMRDSPPQASDPMFTLGGTLLLRGLAGLVWKTDLEAYLENF